MIAFFLLVLLLVFCTKSAAQPTPIPSAVPSRSPYTTISCPYTITTSTASDTINYATCGGFYVCGGVTITASGCATATTNDQYIMLVDATATTVASDDDTSCGLSSGPSQIIYTTPLPPTTCQVYTLRLGKF